MTTFFINSVVFVVFFLMLADHNFGITHKYIYSVVMMTLTGVVVCFFLLVLSIQLEKNNKQQIETSDLKFYRPQKRKRHQELSAINIAFFAWMILVFVLSMADKHLGKSIRIVNDLPAISSGFTIIGRAKQGAYVIVEDNGRKVRCRGYYYHLVEKGRPLSVDLIYSTTFIGFEKTDCHVRLS